MSLVGGLAAFRVFRGLACPSTARYAGGLNFRVRCGSGCLPAALAAKAHDDLGVFWGFSSFFSFCRVFALPCRVFLFSRVSLDFALDCSGLVVVLLLCVVVFIVFLWIGLLCGRGVLVVWVVSGCGLSVSLPWRVRPSSIDLFF